MVYFIHEILQLLYCKRKSYERNGFFHVLSSFKDSSKIIEAFSILIISVLIYSTGVLIEDITDHLTDSNTKTPFLSYTEDLNLLPSEGDLRIRTLIEEKEEKVIINELGKRYFFSKKQLTIAKENLKIKEDSIDSLIENPEINLGQFSKIDDIPYKKDIEKIVNYLYYDAKNWCYTQTTHFQELEFIQNRIDFSRSCFLIAFFFFILFSSLLIWLFINKLSDLSQITQDKKQLLRPIKDKNESKKSKSKYQKLLRSFCKKNSFINWMLTKNLICVFILSTVLLVSYNSYKIAEYNFNERAFGYYLLKKIK